MQIFPVRIHQLHAGFIAGHCINIQWTPFIWNSPPQSINQSINQYIYIYTQCVYIYKHTLYIYIYTVYIYIYTVYIYIWYMVSCAIIYRYIWYYPVIGYDLRCHMWFHPLHPPQIHGVCGSGSTDVPYTQEGDSFAFFSGGSWHRMAAAPANNWRLSHPDANLGTLLPSNKLARKQIAAVFHVQAPRYSFIKQMSTMLHVFALTHTGTSPKKWPLLPRKE